MKENEKKMEETLTGTRDLLLALLAKMGCQYELGGEDDENRIYFAYQGENFIANASNDKWYVHLWDTHWGHIDLFNVDEFSRLRKAINYANLNSSTITIYTIDEDSKSVDVHCKSTILLVPQIPDPEAYLRGELNDFFNAHHLVGAEMARLKEQEER